MMVEYILLTPRLNLYLTQIHEITLIHRISYSYVSARYPTWTRVDSRF